MLKKPLTQTYTDIHLNEKFFRHITIDRRRQKHGHKYDTHLKTEIHKQILTHKIHTKNERNCQHTDTTPLHNTEKCHTHTKPDRQNMTNLHNFTLVLTNSQTHIQWHTYHTDTRWKSLCTFWQTLKNTLKYTLTKNSDTNT